jgi:hypothetical protein
MGTSFFERIVVASLVIFCGIFWFTILLRAAIICDASLLVFLPLTCSLPEKRALRADVCYIFSLHGTLLKLNVAWFWSEF